MYNEYTMSGVLQYKYTFFILHLLPFKSVRKTKNSFFFKPEFQICKRHGDVESSEVEKPVQPKEQHEVNDTDQIDEGKFAISHISY